MELDDRINRLLSFNLKEVKPELVKTNGQRPLMHQSLNSIANWEGAKVYGLLHVYEPASSLPFDRPVGFTIALHAHRIGVSCLSKGICHLELSSLTCTVQDYLGRSMKLPADFTKYWKEYYESL